MEVRQRIVAAYKAGLCSSYEEAAEMFAVGRATVSRLLRRERETGDVKPLQVGGNNPRRVDLDWLRVHAEMNPDARLEDRIVAWAEISGHRVASSTMSDAMHVIGWTHKKRRR